MGYDDIEELNRALTLTGISFTIVLLSLFFFPMINFISLEYGYFLSTFFSVPIIFLFPFEAILEYKSKKRVSLKKNLILTGILSYVFFVFMYAKCENFWTTNIAFFTGLMIILLIFFVYYFFYRLIPKLISISNRYLNTNINYSEGKLKYIVFLFAVLPTIFIVLLIIGVMMSYGINFMGIELCK